MINQSPSRRMGIYPFPLTPGGDPWLPNALAVVEGAYELAGPAMEEGDIRRFRETA
jgi:hypothetical protein